MTVLFSPWGNQQFFTTVNGQVVPATGYKIKTYAAGSSTPQTTYTTSVGNVAQDAAIIINSLGFVTTGQIWLTSGLSYKFVYTDASDVVIDTVDNVAGIPASSANSASEWVASGLTPTYVSATSFTLAGDQTTEFHINRRLKTTNTAGTTYSRISSSAYGALTTVTVVNESSVLDSGLSAVSYGLLTATHPSLPYIYAESGANSTITSMSGLTSGISGTGLGSKIQPIDYSLSGNALTLKVNPTTLDFGSTTLTNGVPSTVNIPSQITTTISSGSTGGTQSAVESDIYIAVINNAGTAEVAWCHVTGGVFLRTDGTNLITTTAEGGAGAADSAGTWYSTTARTNVAYRIVGLFRSTQTTAGTWAQTPTLVRGIDSTEPVRRWTFMTAQNLAGTSTDFTGIPSWAREVIVMVSGMSTNGTSPPMLQMNDGAGWKAGSYLGSVMSGAEVTNHNTGFLLNSVTSLASNVISGFVTLMTMSNLNWVISGSVARSDIARGFTVSGYQNLSADLTGIRFTTVNGTDAFDAGSANVAYR